MMTYRVIRVFPHGVFNLNELGELHIQKRIERSWLPDKFETVDILMVEDMGGRFSFREAYDLLNKYLKGEK